MKSSNKKTHSLIVRVTDDESAMVKLVSEEMNMTQSEMVLYFIKKKFKSLSRKPHTRRKYIDFRTIKSRKIRAREIIEQSKMDIGA